MYVPGLDDPTPLKVDIAGGQTPSFLSAVAPFAGPLAGLVGGLFSARSARRRNRAQIQLAREQMAFQERMSSTAHQRAVQDLRKAGLNPILSATRGQGASTPLGSMAQLQDEGQPAVSSAVQAARTAAETRNLNETAKLLKQQQHLAEQQAFSAKAVAAKTRMENALLHTTYPRALINQAIDNTPFGRAMLVASRIDSLAKLGRSIPFGPRKAAQFLSRYWK